jgi:hypothetical protein
MYQLIISPVLCPLFHRLDDLAARLSAFLDLSEDGIDLRLRRL